MSEPFQLTTWLRRHPLTASLLVVTVCVNTVIVLHYDSFYRSTRAAFLFAVLVSQLSLLAWWCSSTSRRFWLRITLLFAAAGGSAILISQPDRHFFARTAFAYFFVHSIAVLLFSWAGWRFFGNKLSFRLKRVQFSMRQLLEAITLVALLATLSQYADFAEVVTDLESLILLGSSTIFGIVGPGLLFLSRWPLMARWLLTILLGIALSIALSGLITHQPELYWIVNGIAVGVYFLWGLAIGIDAQRRSATNPTPTD